MNKFGNAEHGSQVPSPGWAGPAHEELKKSGEFGQTQGMETSWREPHCHRQPQCSENPQFCQAKTEHGVFTQQQPNSTPPSGNRY
jgi:hypothetical protein